MDLYVMDTDFQAIAVVDDFQSLIWAKRYYDFGDCELYIRASEEYVKLFRNGRFLMRNDDDMVCRIVKVELTTDTEEGDFITVTASDCRSILSQRIVWFQTNFNGTVEDYIRRLVNDNIVNPSVSYRKVPNFILGQRLGLTDTIEQQVTYDPLDEKVIEICKAYGYGTRVRFDDSNRFVFEVYTGTDRSYGQDSNDHVLFSRDFDNIISSQYIDDRTDFRNAVLVAGEGEGVDRQRYSYGTSSGFDRYELFVDADNLSSNVEEGETIDYTEAMRAKGIEALGEHLIVQSFEGEVEANYSYKYGIDYELGDIVQVENDYRISASARITEVIETFDENGYSVIPTFQYQEVATDD